MQDMSVNWAVKKRKASYKEVFQYGFGLAILKKIAAMDESERVNKLIQIPNQVMLHKLLEKHYTSIPLECLLDIAEQLDVELQLISNPSEPDDES